VKWKVALSVTEWTPMLPTPLYRAPVKTPFTYGAAAATRARMKALPNARGVMWRDIHADIGYWITA